MVSRSAAWCFCMLLPCISLARETVCLKNGFCLEADSHLAKEDRVVFRIAGGTLEFPSELVADIEPLPTIVSAPEQCPSPEPMPEELIAHAAEGQGLDAIFVRSVAKVESGLQTTAVSPKGALGLMQLMPATAADLGVNAKSAAANAEGGAKYLRTLLLKYRGDSVLALAAYNAGPGAVARFGGIPPYEETRRYIVRVLREYEREHRADSAKTTLPSH